MRSGRERSRRDRGGRSDRAVVGAAVGTMLLLLLVAMFVLWMTGAVYDEGSEWLVSPDQEWAR